MFSGNFKVATAMLRTNKFRSLLTMLGIIIGISSVVTVVSLGQGLKNQLTGQVDQLGSDVLTVRSGKLSGSGASATNLGLLGFFNTTTLTPRDVSALSNLPQLSAVAPLDFVTNTAGHAGQEIDNVFVVGTSPDLPTMLHQKLAYGGFFTSDDDTSNFAVIGNLLAQQMFKELNPTGESLQINGQNFTVAGVLAPSPGGLFSVAETDLNSSIFIPFGTAQALTSGHTNILQILAQVKDPSHLDSAQSSIQNSLQRLHGNSDFSVLKQKQLLDVANSVINTATRFISTVAAISLLVGGIGIMDIMLVSVSERTREIGIRKAIGATNRQILNQFLIEGLVLSVYGGLIGVLASLAIDLGLKLYTNWHPALSWPMLVLAVIFSVAIGIIFSTVPALKAARKDPIEALRS